MSRAGVVAKKLGMTRIFDDNGDHVPVTVLQLDECQVVAVKKAEEKDRYNAIQIGAGQVKLKNVTKPMKEYFAKKNVKPKAKLVEFRVTEDAFLNIGDEISADHFVKGQFVDICGTSIGKGFAGGMKRHNFGGLRASHGVSVSHRSHGSTGQCQDPGRVFKGKKMAGHMGAERVTMQNLQIVDVDVEEGLILVKGGVPGPKNGWVTVKDAVKKSLPENAPVPASIKTKDSGKVDKETANVSEDTAEAPADTAAAQKEE